MLETREWKLESAIATTIPILKSQIIALNTASELLPSKMDRSLDNDYSFQDVYYGVAMTLVGLVSYLEKSWYDDDDNTKNGRDQILNEASEATS